MNLKELREKNKLTQAAFAAPLGVSGKSIYLIESGRMKLSKKLSAKIAEVYGEVIEPAERKARTRAAKAEKKIDKAATEDRQGCHGCSAGSSGYRRENRQEKAEGQGQSEGGQARS